MPDDRPDPEIEPRTLRLELPPHVYALFLQARRALESTIGHSMTDADFIAEMSRAALEPPSADASSPRHQISISVCPSCKRAEQHAGGTSHALTPAQLERARCDAIELGRVDGKNAPRARRTVPPAVYRAVLARDRHRCTIPGCTSSRFLDVHHITWRSRGGNHKLENLTTLCGLHHDAGHDGRLIITGTARNLIVTHADGRPYGLPPSDRPPVSPPPNSVPYELVADAKRALTQLGFRPSQAADGVRRAVTHVGGTTSLELLIRAALRECSTS